MKREHLIPFVSVLLLSTLCLQVSTAFAQAGRVGVIKANYTMSASGTGAYDWTISGLQETSQQDQAKVSINGQAQYEVVQTATNLIIGNLISSSAQPAASGTWETAGWGSGDPSTYSTDNGIYDADPSFNPTNYCVLFASVPGVPGQLSGTCEKVVFGVPGGPYLDSGGAWGDAPWPPFDAPDAELATARALEEVRGFQFSLTNSALHWSLTVATNTTVDYEIQGDFNGVVGSETANATGSSSVALEYVPDQLTVPFTADPTNGPAPLSVQFGCADVDSGGGVLTNWSWSFGDGTTGTNQTPSHTYTNTNTFSVTLTAMDINGSTVRGIGPSNIAVALPTAQFTAWPTNGFIPLPVSFTGPAVDSGGNALVSWSWNFGDGAPSGDKNPAHIYMANSSKTFSPKLTVTNSLGTAIVATGPKIAAVYPLITFTASPTNGVVPMRVKFGAPAADLLGVAITNWQWNFGDGVTSKLQNPSHTYTNVGVFSPMLVATNANKTAVAGIGPRIGAGCVGVYAFGGAGVGYDPASGGLTNSDGIHPRAGLALSGNRLYGVMSGGGSGGSGSVFAVNTDGAGITNLYQFSATDMATYSNGDGAAPAARLVLSGNTLFGAASSGGPGMPAPGTLFKIQTDGSGFTTLGTLGSTNGVSPNGLALSDGTLYGTAANGGDDFNGTVFRLNPDGSGFAAIHEFSATDYDPSSGSFTNNDGAWPKATLIPSGIGLFGTTSRGGGGGGGTVFSLNSDGSDFTVLHSFTNSDGSTPSTELLLSSNTLYGTTSAGGSGGEGTVFKVNTDGSGFSTLYSFTAGGYDPSSASYTNADGAQPSAGLLLSSGILYGTTQTGGAGGSGTIFAIHPDGTSFTSLYSFSALSYNSDLNSYTNLEGANPSGGLVLAGGAVFTALCNGGPEGEGALFALNLAAAAPSLNIQFSGDKLVISWPSAATGFGLQQNADLGTTNWIASGLNVFDDGTTKSVSLTPAIGNLFLRLCHP